jgi:threonine synthase
VDWHGADVGLKLDYLCPTGSYKDRGSALLVSRLRALGAQSLIEDTSGNAGASMAAYAALAGMRCTIYVPATSSAPKRAQIRAFGADVIEVPGGREAAAIACQEAAATSDAVYAAHNWSPYFIEGMKTMAYELHEQCPGAGWIIMPVGYGSIALALFRGFSDLRRWGRVERLPRLAFVQAAHCNPVYRAAVAGANDVAPLDDGLALGTVAEGIDSTRPIRGRELLQALSETEGIVLSVTEAEIERGIRDLASRGLYVEPTSAVVAAGLTRLLEEERIENPADVVGVLTGIGLKSGV